MAEKEDLRTRAASSSTGDEEEEYEEEFEQKLLHKKVRL